MNSYVITTALVMYKDRYLIAKRSLTKKFSPNQWEFISGFIEEKEAAEKTILRELYEETKLHGKIIKTANPFSFVDKEGRWVIIPFLIKVDTDEAIINAHDHSEIKWITHKEIEEYEDLSSFSKMVALLL